MENYNQKNNSNIESDYDILYLIQKDQNVLGVYDNSDIGFVKFINLIYHDIELIERLNLDEKLSSKIKTELNQYNITTLIKNSDIKMNKIKLCFKNFIFKDINSNIIDLNFLESKIRYYIQNKILEIKSIYLNLKFDINEENSHLQSSKIKKENSEASIQDSESLIQDPELSIQDQEKNKEYLTEKINKLESIKSLQEKISFNNKEKEKEKEDYIQKVIEDKKELESKIKDLKLKKEKLKEQKNIYDADFKIYNVVKKNLEEDKNFKIPELFIRKFEIFSLMNEKNTISFEEYLKYNPFKMNIKVSDNYNKIFESNDDNIAYLSDESEYSDSSDSEASSKNDDIEINN